MTYFTTTASTIGELLLVSDSTRLIGLYMEDHARGPSHDGWVEDAAIEPFDEAKRQLAEYFAGTRTAFDLPLGAAGTPFQQAVWAELIAIPYGMTISYGELARRVGNPAASRAVGLANGRNPISIIVPCHRVVGTSGKLTGYAGGLTRKETLLAIERRPSLDL